jgi:hypothetical protein
MLEINRRELLMFSAASGLAQWLLGNGSAAGPIYLADMHYHLFFNGGTKILRGARPADSRPPV